VIKRGNIWYIDYYCGGKRYREAIGQNRKVAESVLAKRKADIAEGRFLDVKEQSTATFDDIAALFLEYSRNHKLSYERDERCIKLLREQFGGMRLDEITPLLIEKYKAARRKRVGPATVNKELACFKTMFSKAVVWGMSTSNPIKKVSMFREPPGRVRFLSQEEIDRLLFEAADHLKPIIIVALYTGMRKSEILKLTWKDIDFEHRLLFVRNSKNGSSRQIPMAQDVVRVLQPLPATQSRVFTGTQQNSVSSIRTGFENAVKRAEIEDFSFHDLRHTFASYMVMAGVDILTVKELLGHRTLAMTARYAHLSSAHKSRAVETLSFLHSHKLVTSTKTVVAPNRLNHYPATFAGVAKLVDARDLKSEPDENATE
jgi:integrase